MYSILLVEGNPMINVETLQSLTVARKINLQALAQSVQKGTATTILVVADSEARRKLVRQDPRFVSVSSDTKVINPEALSTFLKASMCGYRGCAVVFLPGGRNEMDRAFVNSVITAHCKQIAAPLVDHMKEAIMLNICNLTAFVR